ncbi:unnamed protein product, partial [Ilex paraguariensis]
MKLKINKACDLSSISVLPPHARRSNAAPTGTESSVFGKSQASQLRSQQSFSQGLSSQHGMFSQLSQNSLDEIVTNDQRFGSQEKESSVKKITCLPPINHSREESQMLIPRSSTNPMRKWNSASLPDHACQISGELDHRIGMMETSLSRFGMILDSVQSDIMQVNKGTKEVALDMESIRQKLIIHENVLQQMNKGREVIQTSLDGGLKCILDQLNQDKHRESLLEILSMLSALPEKIEDCVAKLQNNLRENFTKELQACNGLQHEDYQSKKFNFHHPSFKVLQETKRALIDFSKTVHPKIQAASLVPKIEMGSWNSVKHKQATSTNRDSNNGHKQKRASPIGLDREWRAIVESDEEIEGGFSCLLEEKEIGSYSIEAAKEASERILRKARRRKRKH